MGSRLARAALSVVVAGGLALLAGGCGKDGPEGVVRIMVWPLAEADAIFDKLEKDFVREHPRYKIRVEKVPIRGYEEKLIVLMGASDPPDLAVLPQFRYSEYIRQNALTNLSKYVGNKDSIGRVPAKRISELRRGEDIWAVPMGMKGVIWIVPRTARHKKLAWRLLELLSEEGYGKFAKMPQPRLSLF